MSRVEPFPDELVDEVAAALDVYDNGSRWVELKHMEANGFDLAWQQPSIRGSLIGSYTSPFRDKGDELSHCAERQLVLQLRDRLRRESSLPLLSEKERRDWVYEPLEWKVHSFSGTHEEYREAPGLSDQQIDLVVRHIKETAPHIISYLRSVQKHNKHFADLGYPDDHQMIWALWVSYYIEDQICRVLQPGGMIRILESRRVIEERIEGKRDDWIVYQVCLPRVRTRCSQPEDDGGSESDDGEEGGRAAIVAGSDAAPVLETAEHDLDAAATPVAALVIPDGLVA